MNRDFRFDLLPMTNDKDLSLLRPGFESRPGRLLNFFSGNEVEMFTPLRLKFSNTRFDIRISTKKEQDVFG